MSALLRWKGDELLLGATKMAEVCPFQHGDGWQYVIGPRDFVSEPYETAADARQDAEAHVRRLLKGAGVADA